MKTKTLDMENNNFTFLLKKGTENAQMIKTQEATHYKEEKSTTKINVTLRQCVRKITKKITQSF